MTFAFWLCHPCFETYGELSGCMVQPDQEYWAQVKADHEGKREREIERGLVLPADGDRRDAVGIGDDASRSTT